MSAAGDVWLIVVGLLGAIAVVLLFAASLVWVYRDTQKRGKTNSLWPLVVFFTWPLGLLAYALLRGKDIQAGEIREPAEEDGITLNDRLWAALSWIPFSPLWPIVAILALVLKGTRKRSFIRYNAVLSIVTGVTILLFMILFGLGLLVYFTFFGQNYQGDSVAIPLPLLFLPFLYWAYRAFRGQTAQVPVLSDWVRRRGWV